MVLVLGRGSFGKVFLAKNKNNGQLYAIKTLRKDLLYEKNIIASALLEKEILFQCNNQFLVKMDYLFQNELRLYFVMEFIKGGELSHILKDNKRLPEQLVIFYAA